MKRILILFLLFALVACSGKKNDWAAKIEDNNKTITITVAEFEKAFEVILKTKFAEGKAALIKDDPEVKKQAIHEMIAQYLILKKLEKANLITPVLNEVFRINAMGEYFVQKSIIAKIDVPTEEWLKAKYNKFKKMLVKRGVKEYKQAKKLIISEYQKARYQELLAGELKKMQMSYRIFKNDEFEEDAIKKYMNDELAPEDYSKTWLIKIEQHKFTVADFEKYVTATLELSGGKQAVKRYQNDKKIKKNIRLKTFQGFSMAQLIKVHADKTNMLATEDAKDYLKLSMDTMKTKFFIMKQVAPMVKEPTEKIIKAYYNQYKDKMKNKPYKQVKSYLKYLIFNQEGNKMMMKYISKIASEKKIEINENIFTAMKPDAKNDETKVKDETDKNEEVKETKEK